MILPVIFLKEQADMANGAKIGGRQKGNLI